LKDSVESDWVQTKAEVGKRTGILIPALLDDMEIPLDFRRIPAGNLVGWKGALPYAAQASVTALGRCCMFPTSQIPSTLAYQ
jgi:hypothetical protein